jgi:hypothetical protein
LTSELVENDAGSGALLLEVPIQEVLDGTWDPHVAKMLQIFLMEAV